MKTSWAHSTIILIFVLALVLSVILCSTGRCGEVVEGWFTIVWGDGVPGSEQQDMAYFITGEQGQSLRIILAEELDKSGGDLLALNGKYVAAAGTHYAFDSRQGINTVFRVSSLSVASPPFHSVNRFGMETHGAVSGSKPWVSILCKFSDHSVEPYNLNYFRNMYSSDWPGLDHYWRELSYDTVNVEGSGAYGWFDLPHPESYYNPTDAQGGTDLYVLRDHCLDAADPSVDFSLYSGINMMFNTDFDNGYAWGGSAYINRDGVFRSFSITWEPPWGYKDIAVIAHEMGHGFGLPHSSGMYGKTYDNQWDVMSDSWSNCGNSTDGTYGCLGQHTIAYHKDYLGWIPAAQRYVANEGNASMFLANLAEKWVSGYRMVKIPLDGTSVYYTVEVREKIGYDVKLPGEGVIIHEIDPTRKRPANVVDIDGDKDTGDEGALFTPGESYTNSGGDFTVEVLRVTAEGYEIAIILPGVDLAVDAEAVGGQPFVPGQSFTIIIDIRNQGDELSGSTTLHYYISDDASINGWDTEIGTDGIAALGPGEKITRSLQVSTPLIDGTYYYGACVDPVGDESQLGNNCTKALTVRVGTPGSSSFPWNLYLPAIMGFGAK